MWANVATDCRAPPAAPTVFGGWFAVTRVSDEPVTFKLHLPY